MFKEYNETEFSSSCGDDLFCDEPATYNYIDNVAKFPWRSGIIGKTPVSIIPEILGRFSIVKGVDKIILTKINLSVETIREKLLETFGQEKIIYDGYYHVSDFGKIKLAWNVWQDKQYVKWLAIHQPEKQTWDDVFGIIGENNALFSNIEIYYDFYPKNEKKSLFVLKKMLEEYVCPRYHRTEVCEIGKELQTFYSKKNIRKKSGWRCYLKPFPDSDRLRFECVLNRRKLKDVGLSDYEKLLEQLEKIDMKKYVRFVDFRNEKYLKTQFNKLKKTKMWRKYSDLSKILVRNNLDFFGPERNEKSVKIFEKWKNCGAGRFFSNVSAFDVIFKAKITKM